MTESMGWVWASSAGLGTRMHQGVAVYKVKVMLVVLCESDVAVTLLVTGCM